MTTWIKTEIGLFNLNNFSYIYVEDDGDFIWISATAINGDKYNIENGTSKDKGDIKKIHDLMKMIEKKIGI